MGVEMRRLLVLPVVAVASFGCAAAEDPVSVDTPRPVPVPSTPAVPEPEVTFLDGPAPGGIDDCLSGLWAFSIDYQQPDGQVIQGDSASALCVDDLESRGFNGTLFLDNVGRNIEPGSIIQFALPVLPLDRSASECRDLYGFDCTS